MKANYNEFQAVLEARKRGYDKILDSARKRLPVKGIGYYVYECQKCERIYLMHLEKGIEDTDQNVLTIIREAEELKAKAKSLLGIDIRMAGVPKLEDAVITVPEYFACPECEKVAKKDSDIGYAKHIFVESKYDSDKEYDIVDGMNHFAVSPTLGQGIPIIFNGADYENRQLFTVTEATRHAQEKEKETYDHDTEIRTYT